MNRRQPKERRGRETLRMKMTMKTISDPKHPLSPLCFSVPPSTRPNPVPPSYFPLHLRRCQIYPIIWMQLRFLVSRALNWMFQVFCLHHQRSNVFLGRRSSGQCISSPYGIYNVDHRVCQFSSKNKFHNDTFFCLRCQFSHFWGKKQTPPTRDVITEQLDLPTHCFHHSFWNRRPSVLRAISLCLQLSPSLYPLSLSLLSELFKRYFFTEFFC